MKKLLLVLTSLVFSFCCAELFLRLFYPQPTGPLLFRYDPVRCAIPIPNQHGHRVIPGVFDYTFSNNSLGLRGPEVGSKARKRILVLGDSFTYGWGVNDDQAFPALLEKLTGAEVVNAGNGGRGTDYALRFYETVGKQLDPDIVILAFFANDFVDNEKRIYFDERLAPKDQSTSVYARKGVFLDNRFYSFLIAHSHLINLIKQTIVGTKLWEVSDGNAEIHDPEITRTYLTALKSKVEQDRKQFAVFYLPAADDLMKYRKAIESQTEYLLGTMVPMTSLTPALANYDVKDLYYTEGHWKPLGHKIAAQVIKQQLHL